MAQSQKIIMMRDSIEATSLQHITDMMLQGKPRISIVKYIKNVLDKKFDNATMHAADNIYKDILKKFNSALEEDRPTITSNLYTRLNYLYRKSLEQKDITNELLYNTLYTKSTTISTKIVVLFYSFFAKTWHFIYLAI